MRRLTFSVLLAAAALAAAAGGSVFAALKLEEQNDFCAACHTQPEVEYVSRARAAVAADLSSAHLRSRARCIDCHSGAGAFGRAAGLQQGAHDLAAYLSGNYARPAVTTNSLPDSNCVKCHGDIFANKGIRNHYHFYLPDWQAQEPARAARCVNCHTSHTRGASRTVRYAVDGTFNAYCNACHDYSGIR